MHGVETENKMPAPTVAPKVHLHLYLDADTAAWLRKEREDNFMPISTTIALAVREYRKQKDAEE